MQDENIQIGVGIFILKDNEVLLGKRKNAHGNGEYAGPGGHMEYGESFEQTILRELTEEMGNEIRIENIQLLSVTNLRKYSNKHYIDIGFSAQWITGNPKVMEPEKIESWQWYTFDALPKPLFRSVENYIEAHKTGKVYFME